MAEMRNDSNHWIYLGWIRSTHQAHPHLNQRSSLPLGFLDHVSTARAQAAVDPAHRRLWTCNLHQKDRLLRDGETCFSATGRLSVFQNHWHPKPLTFDNEILILDNDRIPKNWLNIIPSWVAKFLAHMEKMDPFQGLAEKSWDETCEGVAKVRARSHSKVLKKLRKISQICHVFFYIQNENLRAH